MQIRFRHIIEDRDRHGNVRIYVRVPGRRKVRIRAPFGTDAIRLGLRGKAGDYTQNPTLGVRKIKYARRWSPFMGTGRNCTISGSPPARRRAPFGS